MNYRTLSLAIFLATLGHLNSVSGGGTYDTTWRYPIISIPRLETPPPFIDGLIEKSEWARATLFPPTVEMEPHKRAGLPMSKRTWIWMGYTSDSIYVAWRQELPSDRLPLEVTITNERDRLEGPDNAVNLFLNPTDAGTWFPFHIAGNAASQLFDRKLDDPGLLLRWNPNVTYKSHLIDTGWEGEMQIPFKELGLDSAPADGTQWKCNFFSFWRKGQMMLSSWPFVRWNGAKERGTIIFAGNAPAVRFEQAGVIKLVGGDAQVQTKLFYRKEKSRQSFQEQVLSAMDASQGEGATFENFSKIVSDALAGFQPATTTEKPGEYLLRFDVKAGDRVLAAGISPFYKAAPLELDVTPMYLQTHKLLIEATSELPQAKMLEASLSPNGARVRAAFKYQRAKVDYPADNMKTGQYELAVQAKDDKDNVVASAKLPIVKPEPPDWWTMKEGIDPKVPPPWTPVKASKNKVSVLGRQYEFTSLAVPSQIETRGQKILAGPIEFRATTPWQQSSVKLAKHDDEAAVYESESVAGNLTLKVKSQVEFDGFTYVDVDLTGDGTTDKLDFVIPFKKEHAILMQNYAKAPGPGDAAWKNPNGKNPYQAGKRFVGYVPDYVLQTPPMMTTWIGTDHYGLEWSCEASRGWAMASPNKAMEVSRDGDKVLLTVHLISKSVTLSKDKPRHIRFGLVATPTKTLLPYLKKARFNDDITYVHATLSRFPFWHEPLHDPKVIEQNKKYIESAHAAGAKFLFHGGWNVSTQTPEWDTWCKEMVAEPLQNVSFGDAKQYAACWNSPFATMYVNSFGYNAKLVQVDGIRFDTVVPSYECQSLAHGCGWYDDSGKLWGSLSLFAQREAWKKLYRIFHGGVIKEGIVYTPNAAGPLMAVHSFSDYHEIGEGYYMHAKELKDAFPPDMVRANFTGDAYGFRTTFNVKGNPICLNARMGAVMVGGSEPRFGDYRFWKPGYEAQADPAVNIWDAWDWVDWWSSQWIGWWENADDVKTPAGAKMIYTSLNVLPGKKVLITLMNYEPEPLDDFKLKLNLQKLGLKGTLYAEDAVTCEPLAVSKDGSLKLDVLGERYRVVKVSNEPPKYRSDALGPNLVTNAPTQIEKSWTSADIKLDASSTYVLRAQIKIDKPIGEGSANPNRMGMWGPEIAHYLTIQLVGDGINGVDGTNMHSRAMIDQAKASSYRETEFYKRAYTPMTWEKTAGWVTYLVPVGTATNTASGKIVVTITDAGQALVKDVSLQKVKP